jgi:acyl carrier protein
LPIDLCRRFHEQIPHCVLLNLYGSSEVAADATWYDTRQIGSLQSVPIGRPIANTQIYILDRCLQPVPVGVPGELYVGGANLARGYFSRPELTAERFLEFGDEQSRIQNPKPTIYKTGDLARYRPDGTIEYLGRLDHQVKIRGVRIELGEIESVLRRHPAVRDAVVVARADTPGAMRLVAYVVMGDEDQVLGDRKPELEEHSHRSDTRHPTPNTRSLRAWLRERLPEHTLPASVVVLETLPLTPNGKVDRRALPPPDQARPELTTSYAAPSTAVEELLAAIWADVLGLERVGIHDNFFELGGYSLKAVQVMSRVREVCEVELPPLRTLFEAPTVADLARAISRRQIAQTDPAALDQLLAEITQLSQDELEATLWSERRVIR